MPISMGSTVADATNLKAGAPLTVHVIVRRKRCGCDEEKVMSKPAEPPGGMTCGAGCLSSGSSARSMATRIDARSSLITVKQRVTCVNTEMVPKSMDLGPPVTSPRSSGESVARHSEISSALSGRDLYFLPPVRKGSKSAEESPAALGS